MLKKFLTLAIVPLVLLTFAHFGSTPLVMSSFDQVVHYQSPYLAQLPAGGPAAPVVKQVVLVVVDGLRDDMSRQLPTVNQLRAAGASRTVRNGVPSLSVPTAATIGSGTWQEQNGVTTNWYEGAAHVDSIFARAKAAGLTTAVAGSSEWTGLFPGQFDATAIVGWQNEASDDAVIDGALRLLAERKPNLLLVHVSSVDEAGHAQGGASAEYRRVALDTDARIARLLAAVDLKTTVFAVTADHGHIDTGGHGGQEPVVRDVPFVASGPGIAAGAFPRREQTDVAPTLAVLLGVAFPADNQGTPLWDMLQLPGELRARRAVDAGMQLGAAYQLYARQIGALPFNEEKLAAARTALDRQDWETAYRDASDFASADGAGIRAQAAAARAARLGRERLARTPLALALLVPFAAWLYLARRQRWDFRVPLAGALAYFVVYNALFFGRGNTYSLSAFNSENQIESYFTRRGMDALIALLVAGLLVAVLARRRDWFRSALAAVNMMFLVALGLAVQILLFYWLWDIRFPWYLPDLGIGFKYYTDMIQTTAFYPLVYLPVAALLPALSAFVSWIARAVVRRPANTARAAGA